MTEWLYFFPHSKTTVWLPFAQQFIQHPLANFPVTACSQTYCMSLQPLSYLTSLCLLMVPIISSFLKHFLSCPMTTCFSSTFLSLLRMSSWYFRLNPLPAPVPLMEVCPRSPPLIHNSHWSSLLDVQFHQHNIQLVPNVCLRFLPSSSKSKWAVAFCTLLPYHINK